MDVDCLDIGQGFFAGQSPEITNAKNMVIAFKHSLGRVPIIVQVQFSTDKNFASAAIVQWAWLASHSGNPVSITADTGAVYVAIWNGAPLHGMWNPLAPVDWTLHKKGFFRVIVA
jgi:hypothetical protein